MSAIFIWYIFYVPWSGHIKADRYRYGPRPRCPVLKFFASFDPNSFLHHHRISAYRQCDDDVCTVVGCHYGHHDDTPFQRCASYLPRYRSRYGREYRHHRYFKHSRPHRQHASSPCGFRPHVLQCLRRNMGIMYFPSFC